MQTNVTSRVIKSLLDRYYPKREITVTSNDPCYITPAVKALLWRKNQLMHARCIDEAGTLARLHAEYVTSLPGTTPNGYVGSVHARMLVMRGKKFQNAWDAAPVLQPPPKIPGAGGGPKLSQCVG